MNTIRKIMTVVAALAGVGMAYAQQTTINNQLVEGMTVRRIVFDREKVEVTLSDGSTMTGVANMRAKIDKSAGIDAPTVSANSKGPTKVYDLQGRALPKTSATGRAADGAGRGKSIRIIRKEGRTVKQIGK